MLSALVALLMAVSPLPASPEGYPVNGVDVASWQHPNDRAINWVRVRSAGVDFVTVKATEGSPADDTEYTNPWFVRDLTGAQKAGLPVAPYHFYLARTPGTGGAQAQYFIAALRKSGYTGQRPLDLPPIFDFEWDWKGGKCPPYATLADVRAWLEPVEAAFGRKPIIYTNRHFIADCFGNRPDLGEYPLQIAHYASTPPSHLPPGWTEWPMWQWTARDTVPGIPAQHVTRSVFRGTHEDLAALASVAQH